MGSVVIMGATAMAGTISESAVPTTNAQPFGIAAGLDGSVWFTEVAGNKIGRLSVGGTFTEFPASGNRGGHHARAGWRVLVYRDRRQQDRANHRFWDHRRVLDPYLRQFLSYDCGGARWGALVRRSGWKQDWTNYDRWRVQRVYGPDRSKHTL